MNKILYISDSFLNETGCAVIANSTYNLFKNNGYDAEIFTSSRWAQKGHKYEKYFPERYDTLAKYLKNIIKYYYNWEAGSKIKYVIEDFKPSIIHIHSLRTPALTYAVLKEIKESKIPTIMTLHDCFLVCPMMSLVMGNGQKCSDIKCKGLNKFNCIYNKCGKNLEQSIRLAMMSFVNKITGYDNCIKHFITPSEALRKIILDANIGIQSNKISTINNFLSEYELKTIPNFQNKGYFLYVGRLDIVKGVHYLLQVIKELPRTIELHIVGKGTEESNLKQYAKENNLTNVKFLGFKNREEIKEEYQNCIATILPCNWFENFPTTNMESFINGKPVIASNLGGIPEQVEHNKTGLLFEPANVTELKECILKYWNNPEIVVEHGKNGYQKAIQLYNEERYFNELSRIYEEVLNEH